MPKPRPDLTLDSLAAYLAGRDVRAIVRGQLDDEAFWVLFGPGDSGDYRVEGYERVNGDWFPNGDTISAADDPGSGWDMLGALFVRAFTQKVGDDEDPPEPWQEGSKT